MRVSLSRGTVAALAAAAGLAAGLAIGQLGAGAAAAPGTTGAAAAPADEAARLRQEYAPVIALHGTAKQEILTIARLLQRQPAMAIDFSTVPSRQYCLAPGAGSMVHFAIEPDRSPVDIVYFHEAGPLIARGLDVGSLPPEPATIAEMKAGVWYYNDGSRPEPFHNRRLGTKMLVYGVAVE